MVDLSAYTDIQLLTELVRRNGYGKAPINTSRFSPHSETLIAIGKDHTANISMDNDALRVLMSAPEEKGYLNA